MNKTGRPAADYTDKRWGSLIVIRRASPLEIFNWLSRSMNPTEKHVYWLVRCQDCKRTVILRSDVVREGTKKCLCHGGRRAFTGADSFI